MELPTDGPNHRALSCQLRGGPLDGEQIQLWCSREVAPLDWLLLVGNAAYGYHFAECEFISERASIVVYAFTGTVVPLPPGSPPLVE